MLPFTRAQFHAVFVDYNAAVWPAQLVALALGVALVLQMRRPSVQAGRRVAGTLAALWLWTGVVYHGLFFAAINPAAGGFAALFVVQGLLLADAAWRGSLRLGGRGAGWLPGVGLVAYALLPYPLLGLLAGQPVAALPPFGLAPCPLTLFTFGVLLQAQAPLPRRLLGIPLLWALVGGSAAVLLDVVQDWPLLACTLAAPLLWLQGRARRA